MKIYSDDIAACNAESQKSPKTLARTILFVLATIQQQLETVPVIVSDFEDKGNDSKFAWGMKDAGVKFARDRTAMRKLYRAAMQAKDSPEILLSLFLTVPGLGLVKAGFLCQLFAGSVGCLDVHNLKLYDIPLSAVRYNYKAKPATQAKKVQQYIALCEGLNGSAFLWSAWCDFVAEMRPNNWANGAAVSQFHIDVLNGTEDGGIVDLFSDIEFNPKYLTAA